MRRRATLLSVVTAFAMGLGGLALATAGPASAYTDGSWKVSCTVSHSAADDPIVLPNRPGASHLHDFFGNASTNASSTYQSMQGVRSTCPNQDRSAYWTPALYQNGRKVTPSGVTVYYVSPVTDQSTIEAFPPDFRMIAGNARNADPAKMSGHIQWGCLGNTQIGRVVPASCPGADGIQARITFPSCWNGVTAANGGDNAPNMRYPSRNACPAGFNRVLPTVRMNVAYLLGGTTGTVTLSSGGWPSIHADFLNLWDQPTLEGLVRRCLHGKIDCAHFKGTTPGRPPAATALGAKPGAAAEQGAPVKQGAAAEPGAAAQVAKEKPVSPPATAAKPAGGGAARTAVTGPSASAAAAAPNPPPADSAADIVAAGAPGAADGSGDATALDSTALDSTVVADATGRDATGPNRWSLMSAEGTLNAPVAAGAGLLVAAIATVCALLIRGARRRPAPRRTGRYPAR